MTSREELTTAVHTAVSASPVSSIPVGPLPGVMDGFPAIVTGDSVLAKVRAQLPELTGALQRVAELILADPAAAARSTIVELAERSGTSPATVTRFCRALGFVGYAELRLAIAGETGRASRTGG